MSEKEGSGGGMASLICLVLAIGLAYLSREPIFGFSPILFLAGAIIAALMTGFMGSDDEQEKLKAQLADIQMKYGRSTQEAFERSKTLSETEAELETLRTELDKQVANGIKKGNAQALNAVMAEKNELQDQVNSLANQLTMSAKENEKLRSEHHKEQEALHDEVEDITRQLVDAGKKAEEKYQALNSKHKELISTLEAERSRTEEFIANRISEMSHDDIVDFINARLQVIRRAEMTGDAQSALIKLQGQIQSTFTENGLVDVNTLIEFDDNIFRINEYEAIIDLYMEKIKTVRQKSDIDEEDREEQIMSWRRLMDQEVAKMEGTA